MPQNTSVPIRLVEMLSASNVVPRVQEELGSRSVGVYTGVATLLAEGGDIYDYEIIFEPPDRITVPSTPSLITALTLRGAMRSTGDRNDISR